MRTDCLLRRIRRYVGRSSPDLLPYPISLPAHEAQSTPFEDGLRAHLDTFIFRPPADPLVTPAAEEWVLNSAELNG